MAIVETVGPLLWPKCHLFVGRSPTALEEGRSETASYGQGHLGLHWPNDVYVGDRKLAGILVEVLPGRKHVIGIGLNTNNSLADAPPELQQTATTLLDLTGRPHDHDRDSDRPLEASRPRFAQLAIDPAAIGRRADELCLQRG